MAKRQGLKRGWLTYTELVQMMPSFSLAKQILNASAVLALSYAAGVMSIATGFFLASQVPGTSLSQSQTSKTHDSVSTPNTSDLGSNETDLLDYMTEDIAESIERYQPSLNDTTANRPASVVVSVDRMYLNELMQSKCNYGPDIGTSTGAILTSYLDENGGGGGEKRRRNLTRSFDLIQPMVKSDFLFPTLWFKFI